MKSRKSTSHIKAGPEGVKKAVKRKCPSALETKFYKLWTLFGGPPLLREFRFHPDRKWRADFAHPESRTIMEIEGGIFLPGGGRHNRAAGFAKDAEKYLEAALEGWRVIRLTSRQIKPDVIRRILEWLNTPGPA